MEEVYKWMLWKGPQTREYVLIDWRSLEFSVHLAEGYATPTQQGRLTKIATAPVISHTVYIAHLPFSLGGSTGGRVRRDRVCCRGFDGFSVSYIVRVAVTSLYWSDRCTVFDRLTKPREVSIVYRIPHGQKKKRKICFSFLSVQPSYFEAEGCRAGPTRRPAWLAGGEWSGRYDFVRDGRAVPYRTGCPGKSLPAAS
jgi:hypothetical protein